MRRSPVAILAWPAAFAAATIAGLILGLTGEGLPDLASWCLLASVPITIAAGWLRRPRAHASTQREFHK